MLSPCNIKSAPKKENQKLSLFSWFFTQHLLGHVALSPPIRCTSQKHMPKEIWNTMPKNLEYNATKTCKISFKYESLLSPVHENMLCSS